MVITKLGSDFEILAQPIHDSFRELMQLRLVLVKDHMIGAFNYTLKNVIKIGKNVIGRKNVIKIKENVIRKT